MSKEQLKHIFEQSSCLTKKQLKEYVSGSMSSEEAHAVEQHLHSCPMCSDAIDGLMAQQGKGVEVMNTISADFLTKHLGAANPQTPRNINMSATNTNYTNDTKKKPAPAMIKAKPVRSYFAFRTMSVAATILFAIVGIWYYRLTNDVLQESQPVAQELPKPAPVEQPAVAQYVEDIEQAVAAAADMMSNGAAEAGTQTSITQSPATKDKGVVAMAAPAPEKEEKQGLLKKLGNKIEAVAAKKTTQQLLGAIKNDNPDKYATSAKNQFVEEQRMKPKEERADVADMQPGNASRATGNSYQPAEDVKAVTLSEKEALEPVSKIDKADQLLKSGKASDALNLYTQEMRGASSRGKRQEAAIGAARCYVALGNRYKAKDILLSIVDEGGPRKREAKRMLKELGWEE